MLRIDHVTQAQERLAEHLTPTMVEPAPGLGQRVWLKLENTNLTHSFKIRGALNAVLSLPDDARARGMVAASSGNHAQGLAYAAYLAGSSAAILMPSHTPARKVDGVRRYGAEAILDYPNYDACEAAALHMKTEQGMTYVSPYNDPMVVAGAGTIGLELLAQLPDLGRVIVCVGGGGLISGIGLAIKSNKPDVEVVGVNAQAAPTMYNTLYGTDYPEVWDTLAEALSGDIEPGSITLDMTRKYVDRVVMVDEDAISRAMRWLMTDVGWLVEGGGAVGVAALLTGVIPDDGCTTAVLISGGNVDTDIIQQVLCG